MTNPLADLRQLIAERCSLEEIQTWCFDLGLDWEELPGQAKSAKVREMLLRLGRRRALGDLQAALLRSRPDLAGEPILSADPDELHAALPAWEGAAGDVIHQQAGDGAIQIGKARGVYIGAERKTPVQKMNR